MARFIVRRLISMVLVLFAVSVLTFLIFNVIPNGDPAERIAGKNPTETQIAGIRRSWGFDKSLPEQYLTMMKKVFTGELESYFTQLNVNEEIVKGIPRTFSLAIGAALIWGFFGILLGLISAMRAGRATDTSINVLALIGISMPVFWLGALCNYYLGYKWGIFPNGGYVDFTEDPWQWFVHLIVPWCVLAILFVGVLAILLNRTSIEMRHGEAFIETVSWALVALVGAVLLYRRIMALLPARDAAARIATSPPRREGHGGGPSHAHDHHGCRHDRGFDRGAHAIDGDHLHSPDCGCGHAHIPSPQQVAGPEWSWRKAIPIALSVGIRPCSGALLLLIFALSQGLLWAGILGTFAMALGTAITVALLATLAVSSRSFAQSLTGRGSQWASYIGTAAGLLSAALVFGLGTLFFIASLNGPAPL